MSSLIGASESRSFVGAPELSFSSRFHLPFSPQRKPTEPLGTTSLPEVSSKATVFQSGLLVSPSAPSKSEARTRRSGTRCSPCFTRRTSIGMSVYLRA